jgi:hypothetical protein
VVQVGVVKEAMIDFLHLDIGEAYLEMLILEVEVEVGMVDQIHTALIVHQMVV